MIDSLTIFSKGGLILYQNHPQQQQQQTEATALLLNQFISTVLLDPTQSATTKQRTTLDSSSNNNSSSGAGAVVEWQFSDTFIVVAIYSQVLVGRKKSVAWIRHLLQTTENEYSLFEKARLAASSSPAEDDGHDQSDVTIPDASLFDKTFQILLKQAEAMGRTDSTENLPHLLEEESRQDRPSKQQQQQQQANKKGKEQRVWHDGKAKVTKEAMKVLDYSKDVPSGEDGIDAVVADGSSALAEARAAYLPSSEETPSWEEVDVINDDDNDDSSDSNKWGSSIKGFFDQMSGNKVLTKEDLEAPLADMQRMLTSKNVANDIANEICAGVQAKLVGKRMNSFHRVKTAVRQALESAISKILEPPKNRHVDLLRAVVTKRDGGGYFSSSSSSKGPYTIVMVGINGVGKSTSLAKIAYYLKSNGCNPLLAACDTFRSGAVEQLNVHAKCLDVPLYHKGYAKDPSAVAKAAVAQAKQDKNDVVLVDTAGRMQNNVPLMKALSKLVVENQPDLVLFVCEALVGNDGMDQLSMFDKALRSGGHSRQIDGIILTKFDTVSDKVGAALTMTHVTGAPVVFVGTGQKYNHLKKLSVQSVIKSLFA